MILEEIWSEWRIFIPSTRPTGDAQEPVYKENTSFSLCECGAKSHLQQDTITHPPVIVVVVVFKHILDVRSRHLGSIFAEDLLRLGSWFGGSRRGADESVCLRIQAAVAALCSNRLGLVFDVRKVAWVQRGITVLFAFAASVEVLFDVARLSRCRWRSSMGWGCWWRQKKHSSFSRDEE